MEPKKVEVSIYCKIGTDTYPALYAKQTTGDQIVEHLLSDCKYAWINDEKHLDGGYRIPGDLCIWYLGTNEKFGGIYLNIDGKEWSWQWGFGESNFDYVTKFVKVLKYNSIINKEQYTKLIEAIKIGKTIGDMYEIPDYLATIKIGGKWIPKITNTKERMKNMVKDVCNTFKEKGFDYHPTMEGRKESGPTDV